MKTPLPSEIKVSMTATDALPASCAGCPQNKRLVDSERRQMLGWAAGGALTGLPFMAGNAQADAPVRHWLVDADAESDFKPLRLADLKPGKPLLVYPLDKKTGTPENESRLNKLVVVLLPEDKMTPETRSRAASGVLAYSGICTHQGCEVKTWIAKESVLACYCHASKFALLDNANVVSGPAPKPLPAVALTMDGDYLAIANTGSPTSGQ